MTNPITQRPRARLDLLEQFVYLGEQAGVKSGRVLFCGGQGNVCPACQASSELPRSGALYDSGIERLAGLRRVPVKGFDNYLLFYLPRPDGIDVIRVLHAARDIESILANEES